MAFPKTSLVILCMLAIGSFICFSSAIRDNVEDACSVTRYRAICIRSLSSFSRAAKRDPRLWARAGVSVTVGQAKLVAEYLARLLRQGSGSGSGGDGLGGRDRVALSDCAELFRDGLDVLQQSLGVLRELCSGTQPRQSFGLRMDDVVTWLSAALTDEETCLEGFSRRSHRRPTLIQQLQNRVLNMTYITSNALALVNKLATANITT